MPAPLDGEGVDERSLVQRILRHLQERTGFALVMATRVADDDWRVVASTANPYAVQPGDVLRWSDSICSRMVGTDRPAPWSIVDVDDDLVACSAPVRTRVAIRAYLGAPLVGADGEVIGTLCAIDPTHEVTPVDAAAVGLAAELVSWAFAQEATSATSQRRAERSLLADASGGALVLDRSQWARLLESELVRTVWSGEPMTVVLGRSVRGGSTRGALAAEAERLAAALGLSDAVCVLGSNRIGAVVIGGPVDLTSHPFVATAAGAEPMQWAAAPMSGIASFEAVERELEVELVGTGPATARATSRLLAYEFCEGCGRKGVHRMTSHPGRRCKYCQRIDLDDDVADAG